EKGTAALLMQTILFATYLAFGTMSHVVRSRRAGVEDLVRTVLNAGLFAAAGYTLLDEDYHVWMGALAIGMATLYAALSGWLLRRRPDDPGQTLVAAAISMAFIAWAIPLQAEAAWIPVGWAVQGLALWWFGLRTRTPILRNLGGLFLVLALGQ